MYSESYCSSVAGRAFSVKGEGVQRGWRAKPVQVMKGPLSHIRTHGRVLSRGRTDLIYILKTSLAPMGKMV